MQNSIILGENYQLLCSNNHPNQNVTHIIFEVKNELIGKLICKICAQSININQAIPIEKYLEMKTKFQEKCQDQGKSLIQQQQTQIKKIQTEIKKIFKQLMLDLQQVEQQISKWEHQLDQINTEQQLDLFINKEQHLIYENEDALFQKEQDKIQQKINEINKNNIQKLDERIQKIQEIYFQQISQTYQNKFIQNIQQIQLPKEVKNVHNYINIIKIQEKQENDFCYSLAFNYQNSILATGHQKNIKLQTFEDCKLQGQNKILEGHKGEVYCLEFSKIKNWLVSGSQDKTIRVWEEQNLDNWINSQTLNIDSCVFQVKFNKKENEIISCCSDDSIKIFLVDDYNLKHSQTLRKHTQLVIGVSLNKNDDLMVSSGFDKKLILWKRYEHRDQWEFQYELKKSTNDIALRVCFIDDDTIIWQQQNKGIAQTFRLENGVFQERIDLKINLLETEIKDSDFFFPSIYNSTKQILVQKYFQNVFVIFFKDHNEKQIINLQFNSFNTYGTLSNNGRYLIVWSYSKCYFEIFQIFNYQIEY